MNSTNLHLNLLQGHTFWMQNQKASVLSHMWEYEPGKPWQREKYSLISYGHFAWQWQILPLLQPYNS